MDNDRTISKYDHTRGGVELQKNAGAVLLAKPTTIKWVDPTTGRAETFLVESSRELENGKTTVFIECVDSEGIVRLALPPKVADAISRQREALGQRAKSKSAKRVAQERKDAGIVPGFMQKKTA